MASIQELGPRQRMINMMYIIFIAMMALNMSKAVLNAFGDVNDSLNTSIEQSSKRNSALMAGLATKAQQQPEKYKALREKALQIKTTSNDLNSYIDQIKDKLVANVERNERGELIYENMDSDSPINQLFFANDKLSKEAKTLLKKIKSFREQSMQMAEMSNNTDLKNSIAAKFNTDPVKTPEGLEQGWMKYNFEGFPLIAGITKLTNIQANAKQVQSTILTTLVSGQMSSDLSMNNYKAIVIPDKNAFFSGETFTGRIVLGRYDGSMSFDKVVVNGKKVTSTKDGQVMLKFPAGNIGKQEIKGQLQFKEGDSVVTIPFESSYAVIPKPNSAVISADKMNVVYRGVDNPLTISIPGVSSIQASAPGMTHVSGPNYSLNPTNIKARKVTINVSGKLSNGAKVSDQKTFRIKEIPNPVGAIRGQTGRNGPIRMQRRGLKISTVSAKIPNFDFDLNLVISGFKIQVPGKPIIEVNGQKLNSRAQRAVDAAKRGSFIRIFDIEASIAGNSSYHLPTVSAITVQLKD